MYGYTSKQIKEYFEQVGVPAHTSSDEFWELIEQKYGTGKAEELREIISRRGNGETVDIYSLLYSSLDLSVDFLSPHSGLYEDYLDWFLEQDFTAPARMLDVACGNGFLTCFYAKIFPESEVIGIDNSSNAIDCANEMAQRLGLQNVSFKFMDATGPEFLSLTGHFDLIIAVTVFREAIGDPEHEFSKPLEEMLNDYLRGVGVEPLNKIADLLRPDTGLFISLERWPNIYDHCWWACALSNAGLRVDFQRSKDVSYRSFGGDEEDARLQRMPLLLSGARNRTKTVEDPFNIISFWLNARNWDAFEYSGDMGFHGGMADVTFAHINPKTFLLGVKAEHREIASIWRMELWQAGPFLLLFDYKDSESDRSLRIFPSINLKEARSVMDSFAKGLEGEALVTKYKIPESQWGLVPASG
jgi:SAM-dependent methyltransferase